MFGFSSPRAIQTVVLSAPRRPPHLLTYSPGRVVATMVTFQGCAYCIVRVEYVAEDLDAIQHQCSFTETYASDHVVIRLPR